MTTIFLVCAALGGTVMVLQFLMSLVGLGGEAFDLDVPDDVDLDADVDLDTDVGAESHAGDHVDSTWLFSVISFRTIVAALAFFGLSGMAATAAEMPPLYTLAIAVAVGLGAMYGVYWLMLALKKLKAEGTPKIGRTLGKHATVYVSIPAHDSGTGKIQVCLQNRTMEYLALTQGEALAPGTKVVVCDVLTANTVAVEPLLEPAKEPS